MRTNILIAACLVSFVIAAPALCEIRPGNSALQNSSTDKSAASWKSLPEDTSSWRREPFRKQEQESKGLSAARQAVNEPAGELNLQGILKSSRSYYAIINGRTVKPGDRIDGWTVSGINRHSVTFSRDKEKQVYDIFQGRIDRGSR